MLLFMKPSEASSSVTRGRVALFGSSFGKRNTRRTLVSQLPSSFVATSCLNIKTCQIAHIILFNTNEFRLNSRSRWFSPTTTTTTTACIQHYRGYVQLQQNKLKNSK